MKRFYCQEHLHPNSNYIYSRKYDMLIAWSSLLRAKIHSRRRWMPKNPFPWHRFMLGQLMNFKNIYTERGEGFALGYRRRAVLDA